MEPSAAAVVLLRSKKDQEKSRPSTKEAEEQRRRAKKRVRQEKVSLPSGSRFPTKVVLANDVCSEEVKPST